MPLFYTACTAGLQPLSCILCIKVKNVPLALLPPLNTYLSPLIIKHSPHLQHHSTDFLFSQATQAVVEAISSCCCQSHPVRRKIERGRAALCLLMDTHSPAQERARTGGPITHGLPWGAFAGKRRGQGQWGAAKEELRDQLSITCFLF